MKNPLSSSISISLYEFSTLVSHLIFCLEIQEQIKRLKQNALFKTKAIFFFYRMILKLKNKYMFMNVLGLYDYICHRNKVIVKNMLDPTVNLRLYLSEDFQKIKKNVKAIKKIYENYADDVIRNKPRKIIPGKIIEIYKRNKERAEKNLVASSNSSRYRKIKIVNPKRRNTRNSSDFVLHKRDSQLLFGNRRRPSNVFDLFSSPQAKQIEYLMNAHKQYDFKIVKLDTEKCHQFYKVRVGDEINTEEFTVLKWRVVVYLIFEVIISNWHNFCYILLGSYCFVSGGFSGFFFIVLLFCFVLIEENYPSLRFWKLCFMVLAVSLFMKLMTTSLLIKTGGEKLGQDNSRSKLLQTSKILLGRSYLSYDCIILIMILIQLVLLDEMGLKHEKVTENEDTSTAFVRMIMNKVFEVRYMENFKMKELYLKALNKCAEQRQSNEFFGLQNKAQDGRRNSRAKDTFVPQSGLLRRMRRRRQDILGMQAQKTRDLLNIKQIKPKVPDEAEEEITVEEMIKYEKELRYKSLRSLDDIKKLIQKMFLDSFQNINQKNKKSFFWQNFSIYSRKPGIDLSIYLNLSIFLWMTFTAIFINNLRGQPKTFLQQIWISSSVSKDIPIVLVVGILIMIGERMIYKNNPKEWKKNYQYRNLNRKPRNMKELHQGIRDLLDQGQSIQSITWDRIEINDEELKKRKIEEEKKKRALELGREETAEEKQEKEKSRLAAIDTNYRYNPLLKRYYFQIILTCFVIGISWIYFPVSSIREKYGGFQCLIQNMNTTLSSNDCMFFQNMLLNKIFFAFFLIYMVLSSLQIRYGEPINKGRRYLMTSASKPFYIMNMAVRRFPLFFSTSLMLDFMLTPTSLDFFQWFKFEAIYFALYANIYRMKSRNTYIPGMKISLFSKLPYGMIGGPLLIFILFFPFFSFMNSFSEHNKVSNAELSLDLRVAGNSINLYENKFSKNIRKLCKNSSIFARFFF